MRTVMQFQPIDPMRERLVGELRALRRGRGGIAEQLAGMPTLVDLFGLGSNERLQHRFNDVAAQYSTDPESDVGSLLWLIQQGEDTPNTTLERRLERYGETYACDARTGLRRSDRGAEKLATAFRDYSETERPVCMMWFFQDSTSCTAVIDLLQGHESFRRPEIYINGQLHDYGELVHHVTDRDLPRYRARIIMESIPIEAKTQRSYEPCASVQVVWDMPVWPVWQVTGWLNNTGYALRTQGYRERAFLVQLIRRPTRPPTEHASS